MHFGTTQMACTAMSMLQVVIACALIGSHEIFPVGANLIAPGTVTVVYSDPIGTAGLDPESNLDVQMLSDRARTWIAKWVEGRGGEQGIAPIG